MPILFLAVVLWGAWVALTSFDPEAWLRLLAAVALLWHPIHEQGLGFRRAFNLAVNGVSEQDFDVPPAHRDVAWRRRVIVVPQWPLGGRQNAVQFLALATVFPALALWGPWWALAGLMSFYFADALWTHAVRHIPGGWSAVVCGMILPFTLYLTRPSRVEWWEPGASVSSLLAGILLLALPWWMAYQKVRRG